MIYARIADGLVCELWAAPAGITPAEAFAPALAEQFAAVPNGVNVAQGWSYEGTNFTAPAAPAGPTRAQQAASALQAALAAGITLTSTGTSALNGTYAVDPVSTAQIFQIGLYASQFSQFPSGLATQSYPDASGAQHVFTVAAFIAFLKAVAPMVSALETQAGIMAQGGTPAWPTQTATIA